VPQEQYKTVGHSVTTPVALTKRKEILVPQVLTDYTLHYHYGDLDRTPVRHATFLATLSNGETRKGSLDDTGRAQLCWVPKGPVSVTYQHDMPGTDDAAIVAARDKLRQALDAIVAQTKIDMAAEWTEWNEAGWLKRRYLETLNTAQGGAVGAWHWLSGTVDTVWQLGVLLYKLDREKREINWLFFTGQWAELDKKIAGYRSKGREVLAEASEVKELLNLIFHDQPTRDLIASFARQWWAAIPPDEQRELAASGGMQIIIDVAIGVLLATFSAGAGGAAYGSAKWAAAGGRLGARLKKLLDALKEAFEGLAKALKGRKRRTIDLNRRADGAREIETVWKPKAGTLSNKEAREWYLKQEAEIPSKIDRTKSLENQAKQAFELRNEARTGARDSMADRELANRLTSEEPNMTWEQVRAKYSARGLEGDDLWNAIIDGSQKSRASVNNALGVKPPGAP
jgi:hypothetical protein